METTAKYAKEEKKNEKKNANHHAQIKWINVLI